MANKHGTAKPQGGGKIKVADKAKEQFIEEIERLRQKADKLGREKTERKGAEEKLQKSEEIFRALIQNSSDIIEVVDS